MPPIHRVCKGPKLTRSNPDVIYLLFLLKGGLITVSNVRTVPYRFLHFAKYELKIFEGVSATLKNYLKAGKHDDVDTGIVGTSFHSTLFFCHPSPNSNTLTHFY